MRSGLPLRLALPLTLAMACGSAKAQQLIGYVPTRDAEVTGATDELDGRAVLTGSASVTARDRTASIKLGRGGTVNVCQTSVLHVTENRAVSVTAPLLFSLDRGAIEIQMTGTPADAVMTPDLRFTVRASGPLDLRLRVARNGDTCVENRGTAAPTLAVSDPFGTEMYELNAGQHVLFEHGSVHDVVDRESSPCGCPESKGLTVADAIIAAPPAATPKTGPATEKPVPAPPPSATLAHPFPTAISEGLAPPEEVPPPATGPTPPVTDALVYNGVTKDPDALPPQDRPTPAAKPKPVAPPVVLAAPAPAPPQVVVAAAPIPAPIPPRPPPAPAKPAAVAPAEPPPQDLVHVVTHMWHKLFGRH